MVLIYFVSDLRETYCPAKRWTETSWHPLLIWSVWYAASLPLSLVLFPIIFSATNILVYFAANVVLQGACERVIVGEQYCDVPLGLYVIRGENVVLIGELVITSCIKSEHGQTYISTLML